MENSVYIRPLQLEDALTSYKWRNNAKIWRFTGNKPDRYITPEIETEWLANVLKKENDNRFAICLTENDQYIGNVFFTDITPEQAEIHIFIGEIEHWGKHHAYDAICQIGLYGFEELGLQRIVAKVNKKNLATSSLWSKSGAELVQESYDAEKDRIVTHWIFTREMYEHHPYVLNKRKSQTDLCVIECCLWSRLS